MVTGFFQLLLQDTSTWKFLWDRAQQSWFFSISVFLAPRQIICIETLQRFGTQSDILFGYGIFLEFSLCCISNFNVPMESFALSDESPNISQWNSVISMFFLFVAMSKFRVIMYCNHLHHKNIYGFNVLPTWFTPCFPADFNNEPTQQILPLGIDSKVETLVPQISHLGNPRERNPTKSTKFGAGGTVGFGILAPNWSSRATLPKTNSLPLQMDGWNTTFLLGRPIFRGYVSLREGMDLTILQKFKATKIWIIWFLRCYCRYIQNNIHKDRQGQMMTKVFQVFTLLILMTVIWMIYMMFFDYHVPSFAHGILFRCMTCI